MFQLFSWVELLQYQRTEMFQVWRWLSAHWVHLSWSHLLMNEAVFAMLMFGFIHRLSIFSLIISGLFLSISCSTLFYFFNPELMGYVGLSGILHGFFILVVLFDKHIPKIMRIILLAGIAIKLGWEQSVGSLPFTTELAGGNVIVDSHLYGAILGIILYGFTLLLPASVKQRFVFDEVVIKK